MRADISCLEELELAFLKASQTAPKEVSLWYVEVAVGIRRLIEKSNERLSEIYGGIMEVDINGNGN